MRASVCASTDLAAQYFFQIGRSAMEYQLGRFEPSLRLLQGVDPEVLAGFDDPRERLTHSYRSWLLSALDRADEAIAVAEDGLASAQRDRQSFSLPAHRALAASRAAPASTQIRRTRSKASAAPRRSPSASRMPPRSSSTAASASGRAYGDARGRQFSADEIQRSWAAGVWTRAYDAKYQYAAGQPIVSLSENEACERLRRAWTS